MKVMAPELNLQSTQASLRAPETTQDSKPNPTLNRPISPLVGQIALHSTPKAPVSDAQAAQIASSLKTDPTKDAILTDVSNIAPPANEVKAPAGNFLSKFKGKKLPLPLLIGGGVLLLVLLAILLFNVLKPKASSKSKSSTTSNNATTKNASGSAGTSQITTVTYWGLWEDSQILKEVIADFESKNPTIKLIIANNRTRYREDCSKQFFLAMVGYFRYM
jgi:hypothetical protein